MAARPGITVQSQVVPMNVETNAVNKAEAASK
jgi:hypothetical protein